MRQLACLLVAAVAAIAANPPAPRNIRVPFSCSYDGEPPMLKPSDVEVQADTAARPRVLRVRTPKDDLLLLVVLDLVGDISRVDAAREALVEQIRALPKNTWVGVLRAQDGLQVLLDPTPDRDKTAAAIAAMPVSGKAGLLDSVEMAAQLADSIAAKSAVRVAVLYVSDSDVTNYREDFTNPVINSSDSRDLSRRFPEGLIREKISKLEDTLNAQQTPIFIAHLLYSSERLNEAYQSGLLQMATGTGGQAQFARSQAEIPDLLARTVAAAQSQYSLVVQMPANAPKIVNLSLRSGDRPLSYRSRYVMR